MDNLDFLDGSPEPNAETQPEETPVAEAPAQEAEAPQPEAQPEEKPAQPRGPDGKFAPKESKPEVPQGYVPVGVVQELREEIRSLKQPAEVKQEPITPPDIFENPEGYSAFIQNQIAQATAKVRADVSRNYAIKSHGEDLVNQATEWGYKLCNENPAFNAAVFQNPDPFEFVVNEYKRQQTLAQLGNADPKEVEAFLAWKSMQAQPGEQPTPEPQAAPPKSIASAVSAGGLGTIPTGPTAAFDNVFPT